jgi:hypothetical protein
LVSAVVVTAAAGSAGVIVGVGLVSVGGGVAGAVTVGIVAAGGLCGLGAMGATSIGVGSVVGVLAGTVLVAGLLGGTFLATAGVTTTGGGWVWFVSISLIFCSKAARAAA